MKKYIVLLVSSLFFNVSAFCLKEKTVLMDSTEAFSTHVGLTDTVEWWVNGKLVSILDKDVDFSYTANKVGKDTIVAISKQWVSNEGSNMLSNGSFEKGYVGFESDFTAPADKTNFTGSAQQLFGNDFYGHHYAIIQNTKKYNNDFLQEITPYHGNKCILFDTNNRTSKVLKFTHKTNPDLHFEKGATYRLSFFAIGILNEYNRYPDLRIDVKNETQFLEPNTKLVDGESVTEIDLKVNNATVLWKHVVLEYIWNFDTTDSIEISIKNFALGEEGNDFCLDSITFRQVFEDTLQTIKADTFICNVSDCNNKVYTKWNDVLVVDNSGSNGESYTAYQWYKNDQKIEGATEQFYQTDGDGQSYYWVELTTTDGRKVISCKTQVFNDLPRAKDKPLQTKQEIRRRYIHQSAHLIIVEIFYDDNTHEIKKEITL